MRETGNIHTKRTAVIMKTRKHHISGTKILIWNEVRGFKRRK